MNEQPNYYAIITADVRYDNELKPNEKLMYAEISALSSASGLCWASNAYFAELYDVSRETVSRWISHLIAKGYVESQVTYKPNSKEIDKRYLSLKSIPIDEKINRGIDKKIKSPIDEKVKENNTSLNNTSINNSSSSNLEKLFDDWQQEIGQISPVVAQQINGDLVELNKFTTEDDAFDIYSYALEQAVLNSVRKPKYVFAIVNKAIQDQIKTVADCKARELERKEQRQPRSNYNKPIKVETKPVYIQPEQPKVSNEQLQSTKDRLARLRASRITE